MLNNSCVDQLKEEARTNPAPEPTTIRDATPPSEQETTPLRNITPSCEATDSSNKPEEATSPGGVCEKGDPAEQNGEEQEAGVGVGGGAREDISGDGRREEGGGDTGGDMDDDGSPKVAEQDTSS